MTFEMWWIWMGLAALFLAGEIFRLRPFFLWLSFSAGLTGILALLNVPAPGQIAVFINVSGILIVLERRFSERYTFKPPPGTLPESEGPVPPLPGLNPGGSENTNIFRKSGAGWEISYGGKSYTVKHSVGLYHIRNLIINSGEWIHCSELKRLSADDLSDIKNAPYSAMSKERLEAENLRIKEDILPEDIIQQLPLNKLKQLREDLQGRKEADDFSSPDEKMDMLDNLEFIEKHLNKITDNKGRSRKLYNEADTDRKAVSAAISRCRNNLKEHKELYTHFKSFIQAESNSFRYMPDRPIDWQT